MSQIITQTNVMMMILDFDHLTKIQISNASTNMQIIDVCVTNHIAYTASNDTMMMMILDFDMLDGNI